MCFCKNAFQSDVKGHFYKLWYFGPFCLNCDRKGQYPFFCRIIFDHKYVLQYCDVCNNYPPSFFPRLIVGRVCYWTTTYWFQWGVFVFHALFCVPQLLPILIAFIYIVHYFVLVFFIECDVLQANCSFFFFFQFWNLNKCN